MEESHVEKIVQRLQNHKLSLALMLSILQCISLYAIPIYAAEISNLEMYRFVIEPRSTAQEYEEQQTARTNRLPLAKRSSSPWFQRYYWRTSS
ncbi:hypothetical protein BAUCODRAFT_428759 [Baudoinia panamericana UAMH 10762]|uniref:Uncharacterized protein n=1 Tax=Baudoinia panamericana (strain UAMH 10762) TaxID=717646 RepID=M2NGU1_BAUPA|nr:uncharacterized protein BAUCODRAFT_428759 [Baudoinia panamericana UAMH 10762]EMC98509.1 hypothetical protein BAUCODRAFT_428759 [Baudoinia panamericana UAMH 10762]